MKHFLTLLLILLTLSSTFSQEEISKPHAHSLFKIQTDSVERKITVNKRGIDSTYNLYYTITNISTDTLTYITNSCFYYNHYSLQVGPVEFDLNPEGGCSFNAMTSHSIAPGESFQKTDWITATDLYNLTKGEWTITLSIPLIKHDEKTYRIDGRSFVKNKEILIGVSKAKIVETRIHYRKRKKNNT